MEEIGIIVPQNQVCYNIFSEFSFTFVLATLYIALHKSQLKPTTPLGPQPSPSPAPSTRPVTAAGSGASSTDDGDLYMKYKRLQKKLEFLQVDSYSIYSLI